MSRNPGVQVLPRSAWRLEQEQQRERAEEEADRNMKELQKQLASEVCFLEKQRLQRMLDSEKERVEERRQTLQAERRTVGRQTRELHGAKKQVWESLQEEHKRVQELVRQAEGVRQRASEGLRSVATPAASEGTPRIAEFAGSTSLPSVENCKDDQQRRDQEEKAWQERKRWEHMLKLEEGTVESPSKSSTQEADVELGLRREYGSPASLSPFPLAPTSPSFVLTRGLARQLMDELEAAINEDNPTAVLENFGLGRGPEAWVQVEQAMRPHLDQDLQLRQQWLDVVWAC